METAGVAFDRRLWGCLKTKRYLATLLVIQPEIPLALTLMYLDHGRWEVGKGAEAVDASNFVRPLTGLQALG